MYMGPKVIINNAFYAKKGAQPILEISALRNFCNILYDKITGENKSGISYKYVQFQVADTDIEEFFDTDDHFMKGIGKVVCVDEVKEETIKKLNSVYASEIQEMLGTQEKNLRHYHRKEKMCTRGERKSLETRYMDILIYQIPLCQTLLIQSNSKD